MKKLISTSAYLSSTKCPVFQIESIWGKLQIGLDVHVKPPRVFINWRHWIKTFTPELERQPSKIPYSRGAPWYKYHLKKAAKWDVNVVKPTYGRNASYQAECIPVEKRIPYGADQCARLDTSSRI